MALKQTNIFEMHRYPNQPGFKRRDTSKAAAFAARGRKRDTHNRIVALLRAVALTADEIAEHLNESPFYIRPCVTELSALGFIDPSDERRPSSNGKSSIVWRVRNG